MIRRKIVMGLLAFGAIGGFASGFHSMHARCQAHRDSFEAHVADVCVRAAKNIDHPASVSQPAVDVR